MTGLAIALVLGAALIHAGWNYLLKKSGGGIGFVWAFAALSALFYAPLAAAIVYLRHFHFSETALAFIVASAVLHTAYYLCSTEATGTATSRSSTRSHGRPAPS